MDGGAEGVVVDMSCGDRVREVGSTDGDTDCAGALGIDVGILLLTSGIVIDIISPVAELHVGVVIFTATLKALPMHLKSE
jgi:hypothetical protein